MKKEFIPCEEALALIELGFNKMCFGKYQLNSNTFGIRLVLLQDEDDDELYEDFVPAPTCSQAFRWFREKHNLYAEVKVEDSIRLGEQRYYWLIFGAYKSLEGNSWIRCIKNSNEVMFITYEEAELACLKKLIEIVKNK